MKAVLKKELERITLTRKELLDIKKVANDFVSSLKVKGVEAHIGGSLAKGTVIRKEAKQDVDIFIIFDSEKETAKFERILKGIKLPGKLKKVHGSRDYLQIWNDNVVLELIPVVKNTDPDLIENVTDFSLSHVKYVKGEIRKKPSLADEIRLAKAFCKAQRCYGAESYIHGFSGYSLELLVIHFGGFVKFLKGISKKHVIDPRKYFRGEREIFGELNASKLQGPVVLIDPTYKYRNVCAGLGFETFGNFSMIVKGFLKSPSQDYFVLKDIDVAELKKFADKKGAKLLEVSLKTDRQEGDIAGTKMKKFLDFFGDELLRKQQKILKKVFDYSGTGQKSKGYIIVKERIEIDVRGPSIGLEDAIKAFKKARGKNAFKKGKYYWSKETTSVLDIFKQVKKSGKEMGAEGKLVA